MYTGSMVGAGFGPYAVMGFVISHQRPNRTAGFFSVDLNVKLMAAMFGESEAVVQTAVDWLCAPDAFTTTPGDEGRRLVKIGSFTYRVVNGAHYDAIKNEEDRREQNRKAQAKFREKTQPKRIRKPKNGPLTSSTFGPSAAEAAYIRAEENGATPEQLDDMVTKSLPEQLQ